MSFFKTILIAAALSATAVLAAPAPAPALVADITPRCGGGSTSEPTISVYLCTDVDWSGECLNQKDHVAGACNALPTEWNDVITSFHTYDYPCKFYEDYDCVGTPLESSVTHLDLISEGWNDKISSYSCDEKPAAKC